MIQGVSIGEMVRQSMAVLTKPSIESFEQYEKHGGQREALTYVVAAAALGAVVSLVVGLIFGGVRGAIAGLITGLILPVVSFYVFAFLIHYVGTRQGGTGTQDEVFYTTALYVAPIQAFNGVIGNIPVLGCIALPITLLLTLYQLYLAFLATRSSMNLDQNKAIITVAIAIVVMFVVALVVGGIFAAIGLGAAALSGGVSS